MSSQTLNQSVIGTAQDRASRYSKVLWVDDNSLENFVNKKLLATNGSYLLSGHEGAIRTGRQLLHCRPFSVAIAAGLQELYPRRLPPVKRTRQKIPTVVGPAPGSRTQIHGRHNAID